MQLSDLDQSSDPTHLLWQLQDFLKARFCFKKSVQNKERNLASLCRNKTKYFYPEQTILCISEPVTDVGYIAKTVVRHQCKKERMVHI